MPSVRKELIVTLFNVPKYQIEKKGKLPAKLAEKIPWNKLYGDMIIPHVIQIKGKK